ncbi:MAG: glutathione S-transferase [Pseudohongiellaceae bacterium]|jgi:glutathione S-transferase
MLKQLLLPLFLLLAASTSYAQSSSSGAMPLPDITVYHLEGRRSERIVWLMEELDFPYELVYTRGDLGASMASIRALGHGMPVAPTVTYGDQIIVESGAIIEMILDRHAPDKLKPALASPDYSNYLMWMHYAEGSLAARLFSDYRVWNIQPPEKRSPLVDSEAVVQYAENFLAENNWFGGEEFSAADIMMMFPLNVATSLGLVDEELFPHVADWKVKAEARPAYQRMLAKARPDGIPGNLPSVRQRPPSGPRNP